MQGHDYYISLVALLGEDFFNRDVKLQMAKASETATSKEVVHQAVRQSAVVSAMHTMLNEYERDILSPLLQRSEPQEQLL